MTSKRHREPARRRRAPKKSATQTGLVLNEYVPASPIRAAFWARATTALKRIAERADETSLERAVAAPTDAGALARAISDYPGIVGAVEELDPLALVEEPALSPPSSCENRFCRTPDEPVDAGAADPADDWLCAANSARVSRSRVAGASRSAHT